MGWRDDDEREAEAHLERVITKVLDRQLHDLKLYLYVLYLRQDLIMTAIDDLTTNVANNTTVVGSAITLIQGLKTQLDAIIAAGNNDPALADLSAQLGASDTALSDAITANTPVEPPPAP